MLIVSGKKPRAVELGFVAEFCPICRDLRACRAREWFVVPHVLLMTVGPGVSDFCEIECPVCGWLMAAKVEKVRRAEPGPVDAERLREMVERLPLWPRAELTARLRAEERARQGRSSREEREAMLIEPFQLLVFQAEVMRIRGWGESVMSVLGVVGGVLLAVGAVCWWELSQPGAHGAFAVWGAWVGTGVGGACVGLCGWMAVQEKRLAARAYALPRLVRALAPLRPTRAELEAVVRRAEGLASARGVDAAGLAAGIDAVAARGR